MMNESDDDGGFYVVEHNPETDHETEENTVSTSNWIQKLVGSNSTVVVGNGEQPNFLILEPISEPNPEPSVEISKTAEQPDSNSISEPSSIHEPISEPSPIPEPISESVEITKTDEQHDPQIPGPLTVKNDEEPSVPQILETPTISDSKTVSTKTEKLSDLKIPEPNLVTTKIEEQSNPQIPGPSSITEPNSVAINVEESFVSLILDPTTIFDPSKIPEPNPVSHEKEGGIPKLVCYESGKEEEDQPYCPSPPELIPFQGSSKINDYMVNASKSLKIWTNGQLNFSVACFPPEKVLNNFQTGSKLLPLDFPCPKCQNGDCFWHCYFCAKPLQFEPENSLFLCNCGAVPSMEFSFWCKNTGHGHEFIKFKDEELQALLDKTKCYEKKIVLLIGDSGAGKTTFINNATLFSSFEGLDDAVNGNLPPLIHSSVVVENDQGEEEFFKVGKESEHERVENGKSATRCTKTYSISYKGDYLYLIDTPGMRDTDGPAQDRANFFETLSYISTNYEELHAVCIFMKSTENRYNPEMIYMLNNLFGYFHQNFVKNLFFVFTHSLNFQPGNVRKDVLQPYSSKLEKEGNKCIRDLHKYPNICVENSSFHYICGKKRGIQFNDDQYDDYLRSWKRSRKATYNLFDKISGLDSILTEKTILLFKARNTFSNLVEPIAVITSVIQENIRILKQANEEAKEKKNFKELCILNGYRNERYIVKTQQLNHAKIVCKSSKCSKSVKDENGEDHLLYEQVCCEKCWIPFLPLCWAFNMKYDCKHCGCSIGQHTRTSWIKNGKIEEYFDENLKEEIEEAETDLEAKEKFIRRKENEILKYKEEQMKIIRIAAKFTHFLSSNAIILTNKTIEDYLNLEIKQINEDATISNKDKRERVSTLENELQNYRKELALISANMRGGQKTLVITARDMITMRKELIELRLCGDQIEEMIQREECGEIEARKRKLQETLINTSEYRIGWKKFMETQLPSSIKSSIQLTVKGLSYIGKNVADVFTEVASQQKTGQSLGYHCGF